MPRSVRGKKRSGSRRLIERASCHADNRFVTSLISIFVLSIIWIVFGQTLRHEFVNYDDDLYVYENPRIINGLSVEGIGWALSHSHADNWHPLSTISHMLDCQIFGLEPWGHHLTNVLLHGAAAVALFITLSQLTRAVWPSAFVGAVFAIHPLRAESVAWVSERKDVLSGVFFMLTLWAYGRYARSNRASRGQYASALVLFAFGLMCKPTLVTLPFVLLLLDYWPLRRVALPVFRSKASRSMHNVSIAGGCEILSAAEPLPKQSIQNLLIEKVPFFVLSAISCLVTLWAQERTVMSVVHLNFDARILNALISYVTYLTQLIWPVGLSVLYPYPLGGVVNITAAILAGLLLLIASLACFTWRKKYPFLLVGWLWFLGVLVPMIGFVQVGAHARADRYSYLSQIGLYVAVTWSALELLGKWSGARSFLIILGLLIVTGLTATSYVETSSWKNSESLWKKALANTAHNHIAHNNLGDAFLKRGQVDDAVSQFRKALEIDPNYPEANNNLGYALNRKGNWAQAIPFYRVALRVRPDYSKAHNNLGISLAQTGKPDEALAEFQKALRIDPDYAKAHSNLAIVLLQLGRHDEAVMHLREASRLKPDDEEVKAHLVQLGVQN